MSNGKFKWEQHDGSKLSDTSVTEHEAVQMLQRFVTMAARTALGDGLTEQDVASILRSEADAIDGTADVAEDQSPIRIPMA